MTITVGALFAGMGGLELGVQSVLGGELSWYAEWEKAPAAIMAHHHPDVPNLWDVTKVDWASVPKVDVITGGSPCQDLSHAGKRKGMTDGTRSNLWSEMREAVAVIRPRLVVWENVAGALSASAVSDVEREPGLLGDRPGGSALRAIGRVVGDLASLGYVGRYYGLRAADVGAAHGRFRIFLFATPADSDDAGREERGDTGWFQTQVKGSHATVAGSDLSRPLTLLPTPAVNDMGAGKSVDAWDAWTERMQAAHGNGNGHGKSLEIEALRLFRTPTAQLAVNGGSQHPDKRKAGGHGPTLADEVEHLLPTPGVAGGGKRIPDDARWSGNAAYKPDGTKVQVHLDWVAENRLLPTPTAQTFGTQYGNDPTRQTVFSLDTMASKGQDWGRYEAAIRRQEAAFGHPAPSPTETGAKGQPRLSPRFCEWLMGLPPGWVTDVPGISRNDQLKALGNGVVPAQAAAATRAFLHDTARQEATA